MKELFEKYKLIFISILATIAGIISYFAFKNEEDEKKRVIGHFKEIADDSIKEVEAINNRRQAEIKVEISNVDKEIDHVKIEKEIQRQRVDSYDLRDLSDSFDSI